MTVLSILRPSCTSLMKQVTTVPQVAAQAQPFRFLTTSLVRQGGGHDRVMEILPSRFQWQKYKDLFHFYLFLGVIPCCALVFYTNVFIGPATLTEIPCDYIPKHWEYHRHPISRFISRYLLTSPQENYEKNMYYIQEGDETKRMLILQSRANKLMELRGDYVYFAGKMLMGKYLRERVLENEYVETIRGEE